MRIAIGGFQHETNTFSHRKATWDDFVDGGYWPSMASGDAIAERVRGYPIPIAGFIAAAQDNGHTLVPTTWCFATPCAHVEEEAYERIVEMILDGIKETLPVDAVYLELHGAMVTTHLEDAEGELLRRVRELVGPTVRIVASLDWHANITTLMVEQSDGLLGYRSYPHTDMEETGRRTFQYLQRLFDGMPLPKTAIRRLPFLIPLCWQTTYMEPAATLARRAASLESESVPIVTFAPGFPAADIRDCGPTIVSYGLTQFEADHVADQLFLQVMQAESAFAGTLYTPDEAVLRALELARTASRPVVIADTQDNPGAGGSSDTTGILRALIRHNAKSAAIGLIVDEHAAKAAHAAGVGASIHIALGGRSGAENDEPLEADFIVESLHDGKFDATGEYRRGFRLDLGPSACLRIGGIRIVVACVPMQMSDPAMFQYVGIEPSAQSILVAKSSAHFRADFTALAHEILMCAAPGAMVSNPADLPWTRLRKGMRLYPLGPSF